MKKFLILINIQLVLLVERAFPQCPQPGLKIESAGCENPYNLKVSSINCSELKVQWNGSQNQTYFVSAMGVENGTGKHFASNAEKTSCDNSGRCSATIPIAVGADIKWNVQGLCTEANARFYGMQISGQPVTSPPCGAVEVNTLKLYPNPTVRILAIDYSAPVAKNTKFIIVDFTGRQAYVISGDAITRTSTGYKLNLAGFAKGSYVLKIVNGKDMKQAKFVLLQN